MRTMKFFLAVVLVIAVAFVANAGGNKKATAVPATEFIVIDSIDVEYTGCCDFSFDQFRKENKFRFSLWNKQINDQNFKADIKPGQKVTIYIAEEKRGKIFTSEEAEKHIASQNAEVPSIAWLIIAQVNKDKSIWQKANTICFGKETLAHKSGAKLAPYMTADGGVALFAREYPSNNGEFVDQIAYIKK